MSAPSCESCRFFSPYGFGRGLCRYNPPVVVVGSDGPTSEYPHVDKSDWCGKYEEAA